MNDNDIKKAYEGNRCIKNKTHVLEMIFQGVPYCFSCYDKIYIQPQEKALKERMSGVVVKVVKEEEPPISFEEVRELLDRQKKDTVQLCFVVETVSSVDY